jgi:hypothetical protein
MQHKDVKNLSSIIEIFRDRLLVHEVAPRLSVLKVPAVQAVRHGARTLHAVSL